MLCEIRRVVPDSTGLHMVLDGDARARRDGHSLVVLHGPPAVRRIFEVTGTDVRLDMVDQPAEGPGAGRSTRGA